MAEREYGPPRADGPKTKTDRSRLRTTMFTLAALQVMLLGCILAVAYFAYYVDQNRSVVNMTMPQYYVNKKYKIIENYATIPTALRDATVRITASSGTGSGTVLGPRHVVTNCHVVGSSKKGHTVWVEGATPHGWKKVAGKILTRDQARDISVIEMPEGFAFKTVPKPSSETPRWGQAVIAVGCPMGLSPMATRGQYVAIKGGMHLVACDTFYGNSGGPIFNGNGELIGITAKMMAPVRRRTESPFQVKLQSNYICLSVPWEWIEDHIKENGVKLDKSAAEGN